MPRDERDDNRTRAVPDLGVPRLRGRVHPAYANPRDAVTAVVPRTATKVLDVGCSVGVMGEVLRGRGHRVIGIEKDPELAAEARARLDDVIQADVEDLALADFDPGAPFDCVCFADVLEHLRDPWSIVRWGAGLLSDDGVIVASVPNVARVETIWALLRRRWPYRTVGVFDRTHLRYFARHNLGRLFADSELRIEEVRREFALSLNPASRWNRWARMFGDFGALQFIVVARRTRV